MPDKVRFRDRTISSGAALLLAILVLGGLQLVVGYGNDRLSCERTRGTRINRNVGVQHAATFWREIVAGSRDRAADSFLILARRVDGSDGRVARLVAANARAQAVTNRVAANGFRTYAAQLLRDRADVPDCSGFPLPAS